MESVAKYTVRHTCGHPLEYTFYGKHTERDRKLRWLAEQPCRACIRAEELRRAQTKAEKQELPPLVGTEKQVAWAGRIRYEALMVLDRWVQDDWLDEAMALPDDLAFIPGESVTMRETVDRIRAEDSARWWIDHAKHVHDMDRIPLYGDQEFCVGLIRSRVLGTRPPNFELTRGLLW